MDDAGGGGSLSLVRGIRTLGVARGVPAFTTGTIPGHIMVCLCPTRPFGAPAGVSVVSGAREVYRSAIVVGSVLAAGVDADSSDIGRGAVAPTDTDRGLVSLLNIVRTTTTTTAGSHPAVSFAVELAHAALVVSGPVMGVVPVGGGRTDPELESMFAVNCVHSIELIRCDMDSSAEEDVA
jgi:hypothetical protein